MPNLLTLLKLEELSLVDSPANPLAMAPLYKRDNSKGDNMTDEVIKMSEEMDKKIKDYMKAKGCDRKTAEQALMKSVDDVDTLEGENERLRKALIDNGYVIKSDAIEKKAPVEYIEYEGEKINKADIPEPILKKLEEAERKEADAILSKKAEETLPNFNAEVAKSLITAVSKMDEAEMLMEALMAADKAFEDKMEEFGKAEINGDMADAEDKMDSLVKSYQKEHSVSYAKAYAAVTKTDEGKALVKEIYKKG